MVSVLVRISLSGESVAVTLGICWCLCVGHDALCLGFLCCSGSGCASGLCEGQGRCHTLIFVPSNVKDMSGVSILLRLEDFLGSLLHRFGVCYETLS